MKVMTYSKVNRSQFERSDGLPARNGLRPQIICHRPRSGLFNSSRPIVILTAKCSQPKRRARFNKSRGIHAPDDISEFLQELVGLLPILCANGCEFATDSRFPKMLRLVKQTSV